MSSSASPVTGHGAGVVAAGYPEGVAALLAIIPSISVSHRRFHGGQRLVSSLLKELRDSAAYTQFGEGQEVELKGLAGLNQVYAVEWQ